MEQKEESRISCKRNTAVDNGGGLIWLLGVIGAATYYIQQAESFGAGAYGVLKALVWPAIVVYKLLQFLGM